MPTITKRVTEAMIARLAHGTLGFNAKLDALASSYGIPSFSVDWSDNSLQFVRAYMTPDDFEASSALKYPMVFLHGVDSQNVQRSKGSKFSGPITLGLTFWFTNKATSAKRAGPALEAVINLTEEVLNDIFMDLSGNWPQLYGASGAVCQPPRMIRGRVAMAGEFWRQAITCNAVFYLDTN